MVFNKVKKMVCEKFEFDEKDVKLETDIFRDLQVDSLDLADLISGIKDEFKVEVSLNDMENIKTLGDLSDHINSKMR